MNDQLKNFTSEHRESFDLYEPSPALWDKIETRLQEVPVKRMPVARWRIIKAVAAAAVLAGIWFGIKALSGTPATKTQEPVAVKETPVQQPVLQPVTPQNNPPVAEQANEIPALAQTGTPKSNNATRPNNNPRYTAPAPQADPLSAYAVNQKDIRSVSRYWKENNAPDMHNRFSEDLGALQKQYTELERSLKTDVNRDQILEAMKQNLEMQNKLVSRQLNVIKEIKELKKTKNEHLPTT